MASTLFRSALRPTRAALRPAVPHLSRGLAAEATKGSVAASAFTVEELHNKSPHEVLAETGTRKEASLRHFTVNFGPQHPAAHGVLRLILELNGEEILRTDVSFLPSN